QPRKKNPTKRCSYFTPMELWTPPSDWADVVLFSNLRSPEYIMALQGGKKHECNIAHDKETFSLTIMSRCISNRCPDRSAECQPAGFCPWRPMSPCLGTSSLHWWQPGENPSSLDRQRR
uniref:Uncharacterized protein n=1 Tax=Echeneis naucrates TaxID=173247 RepID=A0A665TLM1_ECHNA